MKKQFLKQRHPLEASFKAKVIQGKPFQETNNEQKVVCLS